MKVQLKCLLLASSLLVSLTPVWGDLKLMHPIDGVGGPMLVGDVSYDSPDYHYVAASPLGGLVATDSVDNYVFGGLPGLGVGALGPIIGGGLGVAGIAGGRLGPIGGVVGGVGGIVGGIRRPYTTLSRRFGKRIRVIHI